MRIGNGFVALALCAASASICTGETLYYGGNPQFPGGYASQDNFGSRRFTYRVYDNFQVNGANWRVTSLYSNLGGVGVAADATVLGAYYEVRKGISNNNLGVLVSSGTLPATLTYQGSSFGTSLFRFETALPAPLELTAGTYWLTLVPQTEHATGQLYLRDSNLGGGVGSPGIDNTAFTYNLFPATPPSGPTAVSEDFSFGVVGTRVPEPFAVPSVALAGFALIARKRRRAAD